MKKYIYLFGCMSILLNSFSQDLHFSQFNENSSIVNPALIGSQNTFRANIMYKEQWRSVTVPYTTYGASIELKFKPGNWEKADQHKTRNYKKSFSRMAGGLSFYNDKAGNGAMGTTLVNLTLTSFIPYSSKGNISVGIQSSLVQKKVDYAKLTFPNQFDGINYDQSQNNGENYGVQNFIYPDFASGILWSYGNNEKQLASNDQLKADAGFSMYHINQAKQKFLDNTNERLYIRYNIHGKLLAGIKNTNLALGPSFLMQFNGPSNEIVAGMNFKYYLKENSKYTGFIQQSALSFGIHYRNRDAVILSGLIESGKFAIGISYDVNTSGLTSVSSLRGGPEFTIRYNTPNPFLFETNSKARFK